MPFATFTFGDATLTVIELTFMFLWLWIAIGVIFDIFRSSDLSNWGKALWVLAIFVFPLIGVLAYLIIRGHTMHEHKVRDQEQYEAFRQFQRGGAAGASPSSASASAPAAPASASAPPVDDLTKLAELRDRGVLTSEEFEQAKARALA
ncbi:MAG: SHOCT domain-containing protein [Solirubrobacteraceae bacterium]